MPKIIRGARIIDHRLDALMIEHDGSVQRVTITPDVFGLDDFSSVSPTSHIDLYEDGKYGITDQPREDVPAEVVEPVVEPVPVPVPGMPEEGI